MATVAWHDANEMRAFPLLEDQYGYLYVSGAKRLRHLPLSAVVDFGALLGLDTEFQDGVHSVYLSQVAHQDGEFLFDFRSDAPGLTESVLRFARDVAAAPFETEHAESLDGPAGSSSSSSSALGCDPDPLWSGFLVTGDLSPLVDLLAEGEELATDSLLVEPATLQNLTRAYVRSLNVANQDRTRATSPAGCPELEWLHAVGGLVAQERCIQGPVRLKAGHNFLLRQNVREGAIELAVAIGAGLGPPCEEATLFAGELPPMGRQTLDGALRCDEVLRSINGLGGRQLQLLAGPGVQLVADPENHRLTVDVDMAGLPVCYSEESDLSE